MPLLSKRSTKVFVEYRRVLTDRLFKLSAILATTSPVRISCAKSIVHIELRLNKRNRALLR